MSWRTAGVSRLVGVAGAYTNDQPAHAGRSPGDSEPWNLHRQAAEAHPMQRVGFQPCHPTYTPPVNADSNAKKSRTGVWSTDRMRTRLDPPPPGATTVVVLPF